MLSELQNKIEAILFASGKGVEIENLVSLCESNIKEVNKALKKLEEEYSQRNSSLHITHLENKWKLTVKSKYIPHIEKLVSETELPQPVLKTLAVVAFKSPVLQSEVVDMRGQGAYEHIKRLVKEKFITKDDEGRSFILKITDKFYNYFDVEGDEEIRDVFSKLKENQQKKLGDLEIINLEEKPKIIKGVDEEQANLASLKVVDVSPKKTQEEIAEEKENKEKEKEFLSDIDQKIEALSHRLKKTDEEDDDATENSTSEKEVNSEENEKTEQPSEDKEIEESAQKEPPEEVEDPSKEKSDNKSDLEELEAFANKETTEKNEENFL